MFTECLKQQASYEAYLGLDVHGDPTFSTSQNVPCRLEKELKLVRKQDGELFESSHTYFLNFEPIEGSRLDGRIIQGIENNPGLSGVTTVWEAYC